LSLVSPILLKYVSVIFWFFGTTNNRSGGQFRGFSVTQGLGGQNILLSNTALDSSSESKDFDASHELFFFGHFQFLGHMGG
jgi:hypothetical protein